MPSVRSGETVPVVFSMGDPNGIGPEVLLKSLAEYLRSGRPPVRPIVFGDPEYLEALRRDIGLPLDLAAVEVVRTGKAVYPPVWGRVEKAAGRVALASLSSAVSFCREKGLPLLVTPPIHKKACRLAGFSHPGQTEFVASCFPDHRFAMAFFSDRFHVLLATAHLPFREVPARLKVEELVEKVALFYRAVRIVKRGSPRLAMCGLNPHASEDGMFGDEEEKVLVPALKRLERELGSGAVQGPFPADSLFRRVAEEGDFDGIVALYHDQGLIPLKLIAFDSAVNATLGLPLIRTSPDHGTAFDIAGEWRARPDSMLAALRWGLRLAGFH